MGAVAAESLRERAGGGMVIKGGSQHLLPFQRKRLLQWITREIDTIGKLVTMGKSKLLTRMTLNNSRQGEGGVSVSHVWCLV